MGLGNEKIPFFPVAIGKFANGHGFLPMATLFVPMATVF